MIRSLRLRLRRKKQVIDLTANEPCGSRRFRQRSNGKQSRLGFGPLSSRSRQRRESLREKCVPGQNRGRLVVGNMYGGPTAAKRIVVHAGKVVMNQ